MVVGARLERAMEVGEWFIVETERVVFSSWVEREVEEEFVAVVGLGRRSGIEVEFEVGCDEIGMEMTEHHDLDTHLNWRRVLTGSLERRFIRAGRGK